MSDQTLALGAVRRCWNSEVSVARQQPADQDLGVVQMRTDTLQDMTNQIAAQLDECMAFQADAVRSALRPTSLDFVSTPAAREPKHFAISPEVMSCSPKQHKPPTSQQELPEIPFLTIGSSRPVAKGSSSAGPLQWGK